MNEMKNDLELHVFVCTNNKVNKPCCAMKNAEKIRSDLKDWAKANPNWKGRVRINASGCLDQCTQGVAVAIYPQNQWLLNVDLNDLDGLKHKITELMTTKEP